MRLVQQAERAGSRRRFRSRGGEYACGDHRIVVGRLLRLEAGGPGDPLSYFNSRYRDLDPAVRED